ncbi:MAG: UTP--glucose-1-phosphate uridylyltransferase GalU [Gammaproteobacteria bacterium]|nr:UTP--glucose-1-phosphate uridylyltransferase GalU [Gammaproteobacteria bacterium]
MAHKVTKAVFPVGGLGTRFLPATKATPKEMLPVVDKPLIQYAVEEAVAAGIDTLIFVTGRNKRAIPDHFDKAYELEHQLEIKGKDDTLAEVRNIVPPHVDCIYIRQTEALGLGHAVLCAKKAVGNEPFAVLLADDLIDGGAKGCTQQMVEIFDQTGESLVAVQEVAPDKTDQYGIVKVADKGAKSSAIEKIVEKPKPDVAPSTLGVVGRYLLTPRIFELLQNTGRGAGGEIQLTDAISVLLGEEQINAYRFDGIRYDCGSKIGFLEANIDYALQHPDLKSRMEESLDRIYKRITQNR